MTPTVVRWRIVGLLLVYAALVHFNRISLPVAGSERLMAQFNISETLMGAVYSAYLISYTLMMTPGGWFIDRYGVRKALLVVGFGSALCVALAGSTGFAFRTGAQIVAGLIGIRIFMGITNAPFHPSAAHAISLWIPGPQRSMANGLVGAAALTGIAITFYLFGFMMDRLGWPAAFLCASGVTAVVAGVWAFYAADAPSKHRGVNEAELRLIGASAPGQAAPSRRTAVPPWRKRSLILLTVSYAAVGYFQYLFFYWMQHYFDKVLKLGKDDARLYATIPTLGMAVGMAIGGWLTDWAQAKWGRRQGRVKVNVAAMSSSAALLGAGILTKQPALMVTCFTLAMALLGATEGGFWTTSTDLGGEQSGVSAAIVNTGGNAGGALAPYLTPLISQHFGWPVGIGVACVVCFLGAVNWLWIDPDEGFPAASERLGDELAAPTVQ